MPTILLLPSSFFSSFDWFCCPFSLFFSLLLLILICGLLYSPSPVSRRPPSHLFFFYLFPFFFFLSSCYLFCCFILFYFFIVYFFFSLSVLCSLRLFLFPFVWLDLIVLVFIYFSFFSPLFLAFSHRRCFALFSHLSFTSVHLMFFVCIFCLVGSVLHPALHHRHTLPPLFFFFVHRLPPPLSVISTPITNRVARASLCVDLVPPDLRPLYCKLCCLHNRSESMNRENIAAVTYSLYFERN